jgi:molybdopterin-containing oxidoreductase family membrane subunit
MEAFMAWYSVGTYERYAFYNRIFPQPGTYWWTYWLLILSNILIPQLLWSKRVRLNVLAVFAISIVVNIGMWLERFVIVVTSLTRDFVPSSWGMYYPTFWDWATYFGTIGVFLSLMFLFIRGIPAISIFETREVLHHEVAPSHVGD